MRSASVEVKEGLAEKDFGDDFDEEAIGKLLA